MAISVRMRLCILATRCTLNFNCLISLNMEQRRRRICQQRAQESAEQCHQRLDAQRLCDHTSQQMESPEEAEHGRAAHVDAR